MKESIKQITNWKGEPVTDRFGNPIYEIKIEDTTFVGWKGNPNFQGDPMRDETYHSMERKGSVYISKEFAEQLKAIGVSVYEKHSDEYPDDDYCSLTMKLKYDPSRDDNLNPRVFLISGNVIPDKPLSANDMRCIDESRISNVKVKCNTYRKDARSNPTLYISTMFCEKSMEMDEDEWMQGYRQRLSELEDEMPFN